MPQDWQNIVFMALVAILVVCATIIVLQIVEAGPLLWAAILIILIAAAIKRTLRHK